MAFLSLKDLEVLEKYTAKLFVASFAITSVLQPLFTLPPDKGPTSVLGKAAIGGILGAIAYVVPIEVIWRFLYTLVTSRSRVLRDLSEPLALLVLLGCGLACLGMGALALCKFSGLESVKVGDPLPSVNFFWELVLFAYGLRLLQTYERWTESFSEDTSERYLF
jgi:hypothetical protein